jgi:hypothetical protein
MKIISFIATICILLFACNSEPKSFDKNQLNITIDTSSISQKTRNILIEELKKIKQILNTNDKQQIATIFKFPKTDSEFSVYVDDSSFNEQVKQNSNNITTDNFLKYYNDISTSIWLDNVKFLFNTLPIDSLHHKGSLELSNIIEKEPCYYSYKIEVIGDNVTLMMSMNSNQNFKSKKPLEDEIEENASEICEHSFWWTFKLEGNKLIFKNMSGAG